MNIIHKHLRRVLPKRWERILKDPRRSQRVWGFTELVSVVMKGLVGGCKTLREIEMLSAGSGRRVPDTTLSDLLKQIDCEPLNNELAKGVKEASRNHELDTKELPIRLIAIDGKCLSKTSYEVNEYSVNNSQKGFSQYSHNAIRAFYASSTVKLMMAQQLIPKETNEKGLFKSFLAKLVSLYSRTNLLDVLSLDAGFISKANVQEIINYGLNYIIAVKDPTTHFVARDAMELLGNRTVADKVEEERVNGKRITRSLYRCVASTVNGWSHAKEFWRIHKQIVDSKGKVSSEDHYYVTSLPISKLSNRQVLKAVRLHWSIENNANWVLDVAWKEDTMPWCNQALEFLSFMRMIAYNAVARFKLRRLRRANAQGWTWAQTLLFIKMTLFTPRVLPNFTTL